MRTARSRSSGEYRVPFGIGSILSQIEPSEKPGPIHIYQVARPEQLRRIDVLIIALSVGALVFAIMTTMMMRTLDVVFKAQNRLIDLISQQAEAQPRHLQLTRHAMERESGGHGQSGP